jgi:hypothetical protein
MGTLPGEIQVRTALYFPHTEVRSKNLIHTALLMWDQLETIVPWKGYRPQYKDAEAAAAMELIGTPRAPTEAEKLGVHALVEELLRDGVPETLRYSPRSGQRDDTYEMWPQKLLRDTWKLLRRRGLTDRQLDNQDYPMSQAAGLTVMAILVDFLAGQTRARITDRQLAYATMANAPKIVGDAHEPMRVVPLTLKGVAVDRIPLDRLIDYRRREAKERGSDYRKLRHNYLEAVEKHLAAISAVAPNSRDREELDRTFQSDMEDDLRHLKAELGFARRDAWLSKDVLALTIAGGGLLAAAFSVPQVPAPEVISGTGAIAMLGGMLGTGNKLAKARYDVMRKHPMAYLYEVAG